MAPSTLGNPATPGGRGFPARRRPGPRTGVARLAAMPSGVGSSALDDPFDRLRRAIRRNLGWYQVGRNDPTTRLGPTGMVRAVLTPEGPATLTIDWSGGEIEIAAWGPGADRARATGRPMPAIARTLPAPPPGHPLVHDAARWPPRLAAGRSGDLSHVLLPTIIAQPITA